MGTGDGPVSSNSGRIGEIAPSRSRGAFSLDADDDEDYDIFSLDDDNYENKTPENKLKNTDLIHYGNTHFDPTKVRPVENGDSGGFLKPKGGFWTSPVDARYSWKDFAETELSHRDLSQSFAVRLKPSAKVLTISSRHDFPSLPTTYTNGKKVIDFKKLASQYDAVWLTTDAVYDTHGYPDEALNLYGWDAETVYIMNPDAVDPHPHSTNNMSTVDEDTIGSHDALQQDNIPVAKDTIDPSSHGAIQQDEIPTFDKDAIDSRDTLQQDDMSADDTIETKNDLFKEKNAGGTPERITAAQNNQIDWESKTAAFQEEIANESKDRRFQMGSFWNKYIKAVKRGEKIDEPDPGQLKDDIEKWFANSRKQASPLAKSIDNYKNHEELHKAVEQFPSKPDTREEAKMQKSFARNRRKELQEIPGTKEWTAHMERLDRELKKTELIHYGNTKYDPAKVAPVKNDDGSWNGGVKPYSGGLWLSPANAHYSWERFVETDMDDSKSRVESFSIKLDPKAKVLIIDSLADLKSVSSRRIGDHVVMDFEALAKEYDAIWLTEKGMWDTRDSAPGQPTTYGWDCETIYVMNPDVIKPL